MHLKQVNEQKDSEYVKFKELKDSLLETRNEMKNLDNKSRFRCNHRDQEKIDLILCI